MAVQVEKKHPRVSGCSVSDVVKQKSAFQHTWYSNDFVWKSKAGWVSTHLP